MVHIYKEKNQSKSIKNTKMKHSTATSKKNKRYYKELKSWRYSTQETKLVKLCLLIVKILLWNSVIKNLWIC